jgi:hypothetical protein
MRRRLSLYVAGKDRTLAAAIALCLSTQAIVACVLAAPVTGCCCARTAVTCHCKICSRARSIEAGTDLLETCAPKLEPGIDVHVDLFVVPPSGEIGRAVSWQPPELVVRAFASPEREVPTPPPLQQG